jgi:hypothetical protein
MPKKRKAALEAQPCTVCRFYFCRFGLNGLRGGVVAFADRNRGLVFLRWLFALLDNSARAAMTIFAVSILYRAAVVARFESFARDCLGL